MSNVHLGGGARAAAAGVALGFPPALTGLSTSVETSDLDNLGSFEHALAEAVVDTDPVFGGALSHLALAAGKRVRPRLLFAAAATVTGSLSAAPRVISAAVSLELVHISSLHHDDVIDDSEIRRGIKSVNAKWGNTVAVLSGDVLLARASTIGIDLGVHHARILAEALERLCAGQVTELLHLYDAARTTDSYFRSIAGKTASLTAAACALGAIEVGASPAAREQLQTFGHHFGMAFQVIDDVLDLCSTQTALGKPVGNDLQEGVYTLPVLLARDRDPDLARFLGRALDEDEVHAAVTAFRASPGVREATAIATRELALAAAALDDPRVGDNDGARYLRRLLAVALEPVGALT